MTGFKTTIEEVSEVHLNTTGTLNPTLLTGCAGRRLGRFPSSVHH